MRCRAARARELSGSGLLGVLSLAAALGGCTLLSDFEIDQCSEDAQCAVDGQARICEERRCVEGCRDNGQCRGTNTRGGIAICPVRGAACVTLESGECFRAQVTDQNALDPLRGEDLSLVGLFAPNVGANSPPSPADLIYTHAIDELNAAAGGLPAPGRRWSPVVGLLCDADPGAVDGAMIHLSEALGVEAVLTPAEPDALRAAVAGRDPNVFFLSPFWDPGPTVPRSDSLWYLLGEQTSVAPAYAPIFERLQARVQEEQGLGAAEQRVALVSTDAPDADLDRRLLAAVERELGFDGEAGLELERSGLLKRFVFRGSADLAAVGGSVAAYAPHLVLTFASGQLDEGSPRERSEIVREVEAQWQAPEPPPYHVLGPGNFEDDALTRLGEDAGLRGRLIGINVHRALDPFLANALALAYDEEFAASRFAATPNLYDGVYLLAYAMAAQRRMKVERADATLLDGFRAVTDLGSGRPVTVGPGPDGIELAFDFLGSGRSFALYGVTGPPDFDPETHHRPSGATAYCLVQREFEGQLRVLWSVDQWVYDSASRRFAWRGREQQPTFCLDGFFEP